MGSLVPNINMSRGNNRKTKFNISHNTHTTAEVGYLQPTFSKVLLPDSDLKLKVSDFIRMSSLVVPSFGDLSLRHWFNCTPVSSLWSCYGAFMSGSHYNDVDSDTGTSVPRYMPMASMSELFRYITVVATKGKHSGIFIPQLTGNLTYMRNLVDGKSKVSGIMSFDEFENDFYSAESGNTKTVLGKYMDKQSAFAIYGLEANWFPMNTMADVSSKYELRHNVPLPAPYLGLVVKNTDNIRKRLTTKSGICTFPTKEECPYVVIRVINKDTKQNNQNVSFKTSSYQTSTTSLNASAYESQVQYFPLTRRMYQGDTAFHLYLNGWEDYAKKESDTKYWHNTGTSRGWYLHADDSYFTGDLTNSKFDVTGISYDDYQPSKPQFGYSLNWSRRFKRMRKLFVGLGYQFNPFDTQPQTLWKIMHYYKAWFDMFYPKRDIQYYQTPLSRFVNFISYHGKTWKNPNILETLWYEQNSGTSGYSFSILADFIDMVFACSDAKYLMPIDYYSLADPNPSAVEDTKNEKIVDNQDARVIGSSFARVPGEDYSDDDTAQTSFGLGVNVQSYNISSGSGIDSDPLAVDGFTIKLAQKLTKFLTKKRIVGKSISDRMRAIYGAVDPHDKAHESTWCFGTTSSPINISAVMSQSESETMHLGDYAGQGIGGSNSRTFSVDGNDADMYIVTIMSAIVPKLAYYQGHSRENLVGISPNDFVTPLWDGVGYEDVHASEYIADITDCGHAQVVGGSTGRTMAEINGQTIGLVPRGTWYKVSPHDILNGDMSLPTTKDSMSPYVLTRDVHPDFSISPIDMRTVEPDSFNKIFNESDSLDDHFIIQLHIEADMYAPLKSISNSYDTFDGDEDGNIEVSHS